MDLDTLADRSKTLVTMRTICKFWRDKGYSPTLELEEDENGVFYIKSNIINGYPPKKA